MTTTRVTTTTTIPQGEDATSTTTTTTLYTFAELPQDAQDAAVQARCEDVARFLDVSDLDAVIRETWAFALAEDGGGQGSRPDLESMVTGWDIDRGWSLDVTGTLDRESAPKLPWPAATPTDDDDPEDPWVEITSHHYYGGTIRAHSMDADDPAAVALVAAITDAMHAALRAGQAEGEYMTGEECARAYLADDDQLYTADGSPA